jgi:hypothetical protein
MLTTVVPFFSSSFTVGIRFPLVPYIPKRHLAAGTQIDPEVSALRHFPTVYLGLAEEQERLNDGHDVVKKASRRVLTRA